MTSPHEQALAAATAAIQEVHFDSYGLTRETAEAAITAYLAALPVPDLADGLVAVKPLEWEPAGPGEISIRADAIGLRYYAYRDGADGRWHAYTEGYAPEKFGDFATRQDAIEVVSVAHERRILSAIDTTDLSTKLAAVERERDAFSAALATACGRWMVAEAKVKTLTERLAEMEAGR